MRSARRRRGGRGARGVTTELAGSDHPTAKRGGAGAMEPARFGRVLAGWMLLVVVLQIVAWLSGMRGAELAAAVERGAAQVEAWSIGEVGDDVVRDAIRTQQDTLPFWATLSAFGDLVLEPAMLGARAVLATVLFCGFAALTGRPIRFDATLAACAMAQGFWVLGLALRVALAVGLGRPEAETSATLLLGPGMHPAALWVALRQVDAFVMLGYGTMALGAWRRGQTNLVVAVLICGGLWMSESLMRIAGALLLGAGMRMTLIPG